MESTLRKHRFMYTPLIVKSSSTSCLVWVVFELRGMASSTRRSPRLDFFQQRTHQSHLSQLDDVGAQNYSSTQTDSVLGLTYKKNASKKRSYQHMNDEGTSSSVQIRQVDELDHYIVGSTSSFGQAHFQKTKQGVGTHYKDFGDNIHLCDYCDAFYWETEENTNGLYTNCCKGGQVILQSPNPVPHFLQYLLDPNNGAQSKHFRDNIFQSKPNKWDCCKKSIVSHVSVR